MHRNHASDTLPPIVPGAGLIRALAAAALSASALAGTALAMALATPGAARAEPLPAPSAERASAATFSLAPRAEPQFGAQAGTVFSRGVALAGLVVTRF